MATDVLGFATRASKSNPKSILSSSGKQTDINSIKKNAGVLSGVVGQGADASYKTFLQQQKQQKTQTVPVPKPQQQKSQSLLSKVGGVVKNVGNAAITSERTVAKAVSRELPGGNADIEANVKQSNEASDRIKQIQGDIKSGKVNKTTGASLIKQAASQADKSVKTQKSIQKDMPTKGQIAAGGAGTAADILTAGALPEVKEGILGIKTAKAAKVATRVAANASAGGLNAAAGGGDKKTIAENAVAGAVLPEAVGAGARVVAKPIQKSVASIGEAKNLLARQKAQTVLKAADTVKEPKTVATAVNTEHVKQGLISPEVKTMPISDLSISAEHAGKKIDNAKVKQYEKQIKDGEPIEPVVTHNINGNTVVVDGQHKLAAMQNLGIKDIPTVEKVAGATPQTPAEPVTTKLPHETDEAFAHRYVAENPERVAKDYADRTRQEFGNTKDNVVSGDEAKFIIPDFGPDKSVPYHEAASAYAKQHYAKLLKDPATKDQHVLITAGGSGAGKTSSLREVMGAEGHSLDDFAAVVDTNLGDMKGASSRINAALASGRKVDINYTYRHPDEAYMDGVVPRAARTGRVVTPAIHDSTHTGSLKTIFELQEKYKDDPRVDINIIDNSRGRGNQTIVPLDFLKDKAYNKGEVEQRTNKLLDEALANKQLTQEQVNELRGSKNTPNPEEPRASSPRSDEAAKQSSPVGSSKPAPKYLEQKLKPTTVLRRKEPDMGVSKLARGVEANAVKAKLVKDLGDLPEYKKVNMEDQARYATDLLAKDEQKANRIALGQESPPSHILPESVYVAVENKAIKDGNVDLLRQLANSSRVGEATAMGQRIRALGERDPNGAVPGIRSIQEARVASLERQTGKKASALQREEVKAIKAETPKVTKETWDSFIEGLKC